MTDKERLMILDVAEYHSAGLWVKTMLYYCLRPGETERLRAAHINYKAKLLYVDGTKTPAAERYVPVSDELLEEFQKLEREPFDLIFQNRRSGSLTKKCRSTLWKGFTREVSIRGSCQVYRNQVLPPFWVADDLIPYCMRHTFITDLKDAMVPDAIRKELVGHQTET